MLAVEFELTDELTTSDYDSEVAIDVVKFIVPEGVVVVVVLVIVVVVVV